MKKTLFAVTMLMGLTLAGQGHALTAQAWQAQLQQQLADLKKLDPALNVSGAVTVTRQGDRLLATLPVMNKKGAASDNNISWQTPVIQIETSALDKDVKAMIFKPQGLIEIAQADAALASNRITFPQLALQLIPTKQIEVDIQQLRSQQIVRAQSGVLTIDHAHVTYKSSAIKDLSLVQLFALLQQQLGKEKLLADAKVEGLMLQSPENTLRLKSLDAQVDIAPVTGTEKVTVRNAIKVTGLQRDANKITASFVPQDLELVGTVSNLPRIVLQSGGILTNEALQKEMVAAGTRVTLDTLRAETSSGIVMTGHGALTPDLKTPLGLVGGLVLQADNLQAALTKLQQQNAAAKDAAQTEPQKPQNLVGLMLLQGMGRQEQNSTVYQLDLRPDGGILLNDQDISVLLQMLKATRQSTAPLTGAPVPAEAPQVPAVIQSLTNLPRP